jgi:hypothetical protein
MMDPGWPTVRGRSDKSCCPSNSGRPWPMFAGSLRWRSQERHKRERWEGNTIRPWAMGHAGCSMMLITCLSRTSLLRILPSPPCCNCNCLCLQDHPSPSFSRARPIAWGRSFRSTPRNPLTQPRLGLAPLGHRCNEYIPGLDLLDNPPHLRKHVGTIPSFSTLACCVPGLPPAARQGILFYAPLTAALGAE